MYFDLQISGEYFTTSPRRKVNQKFRYLKATMEMVADREAWGAMFPEKQLPLKRDLNNIHEKCSAMNDCQGKGYALTKKL